jgi:beta-glucosidase
LAQDEINMINIVSLHAQGKVVVSLKYWWSSETASWKDKVDAILLPWQPGQKADSVEAAL